MIVAIHQPHYMPWLGYLRKMKDADLFVYLDKTDYTKNYFINRNKILINDEKRWLTVPVLTKGRIGQAIKDVEVNWNRPTCEWNDRHCRTLLQNYSKCIRDKQEKIKEFYDFKGKLLIDWCIRSVELLRQAFGINTPIIFESDLDVSGVRTERLVNICRAVGADTYLSGTGAKKYIDIELFDNIDFKYLNWRPSSDLSALHYLLNEKINALEEGSD